MCHADPHCQEGLLPHWLGRLLCKPRSARTASGEASCHYFFMTPLSPLLQNSMGEAVLWRTSCLAASTSTHCCLLPLSIPSLLSLHRCLPHENFLTYLPHTNFRFHLVTKGQVRRTGGAAFQGVQYTTPAVLTLSETRYIDTCMGTSATKLHNSPATS